MPSHSLTLAGCKIQNAALIDEYSALCTSKKKLQFNREIYSFMQEKHSSTQQEIRLSWAHASIFWTWDIPIWSFTGISCRSQGMGGGHVCGHPEGVTRDYTGHMRDYFLDKSLVEVILGPGQSVRKYFQKFTGCTSCSCYKEGEFCHLVHWDWSIIRTAESPAWGGYWKNGWGR